MTLLFVGLMLLSNGMVWTFFVKALHSKGGSVVATVTSSTANFLISVRKYEFAQCFYRMINISCIVLGSIGQSRLRRNHIATLVDGHLVNHRWAPSHRNGTLGDYYQRQ